MDKMSKFLVTGAEGAVGRKVVELLFKEGQEVIATDLYPKEGNPSWYESLDLTSAEAEDKLLGFAEGVDHIIHTAAVVDIGANRKLLQEVNVEATKKLARVAAQKKVTSFIFISSGSIYKPKRDFLIFEGHPIKGNSPYETSKIHAEDFIQSFLKARNINYTILRPALIYGPNCRYLGASLAAIPTILKETFGKKVLGFTGGPRTNWVHVEDVARACIWSAVNPACWMNRILNVCDSFPISFGETITMYLEEAGLRILAKIPLPPPEAMILFKPIISIPGVVEGLSKLSASYWGALKEQRRVLGKPINDSLVVKMDREATPYLYNNMAFSNEALLHTGFLLKYPVPRAGIKQTLTWYKERNWTW